MKSPINPADRDRAQATRVEAAYHPTTLFDLPENVKDRFHDLLRGVLPHPAACRSTADLLRNSHPHLTPPELAQEAVKSARKWAIAAGAATGMVANPISMIPAALADIAAMLKLEGTLAGVIAAILDPQSLNDPQTFQTDIISILFPAAASQALRQVAIRAGEQSTKALVRKYAGQDLLKTVVRFATEWIGLELTEKAIITKSVPLIGAGIGAAWNWFEVRAVGKRAIQYHLGELTPAAKNPANLPELPAS